MSKLDPYSRDVVVKQLNLLKGSKQKTKLLASVCEKDPHLSQLLTLCFNYEKVWGVADKTLKKVESIPDLFRNSNDSLPNSLYDFYEMCDKSRINQKDLREFAAKVCREDWEFYKLILLKDLKCGVGIGLITKLLPEIRRFLTQAASKNLKVLDFSKNKYIVEPKLDGVRCIAFIENGTVTLYSRNGKQINNFKAIELELIEVYGAYANIAVDGELLCDKSNFRALMQTLYSNEPKDDIVKCTTFNSFDILKLSDFRSQCCTTKLSQRKQALRSGKNFIKVVSTYEINSYDEMEKLYLQFVDEGYEGIMIKSLHSNYKFKRTDDWLKLKPSDEYTIIITDFKEGTGKYRGMLGSFCGYYVEDESITVDCGSGLSDEERKEYWDRRNELLGTKFDVASDCILETGSLRFPVFVRLREDL